MFKKIVIGLCLFVCISLIVCNLSTNKTNSAGKATSVSQLKINNSDISGWKLSTDADSFYVVPASGLDHAIDGGSVDYVNNGIIEAAIMKLVGPNGTGLGNRAFIMDFGNETNAINMFKFKKTSSAYSSQETDVSGYDLSVAFAYTGGIEGVTVFAHFKKFYLELPFTGYSDQGQSLQTASQFLGFYKSKIE